MKTKLLLFFAFFLAQTTLVGQSVSLTKATFDVAETISITWTGGSGSGSDWLGIYYVGETPGSDTSAIKWDYISTTNGAVEVENLTRGGFNRPLPAGNYYVALLLNDSYTVSDSFNFTISTAASVSSDKTDYAVNEAVAITYTGGLGLSTDWVAIYDQSVTDPDGSYFEWSYVTSGQEAAGTLTINPTSLPKGNYYAVLLTDDSYTALSNKVNFTVDGGVLSTDELVVDKLGVYPNPVNAIATVQMKQNFNKVELLDNLGRKVLESKNINKNTYRLDVQDLSSGIYVIRVYGDKVYDSKIIIE